MVKARCTISIRACVCERERDSVSINFKYRKEQENTRQFNEKATRIGRKRRQNKGVGRGRRGWKAL